MLVRAFWDDPCMTWVMPSEDLRRRALPVLMRSGVQFGLAHGSVDVSPGDLAGAASWMAPGYSVTTAEMNAMWLPPMAEALGDEAMARFVAAQEHTARIREVLQPGDHLYLSILGVEPEFQRQGIGKALIAPRLGWADGRGLACYLDTFKERNVAFYQQSGFAVATDSRVPEGPRVWTMVRAPRLFG
jgi:GNAT superfamily N-acetyltransferase